MNLGNVKKCVDSPGKPVRLRRILRNFRCRSCRFKASCSLVISCGRFPADQLRKGLANLEGYRTLYLQPT